MNVWLFLVGFIGYAIAFLLDEGYEHKPKTRKNEVLHKIYSIFGILSLNSIIEEASSIRIDLTLSSESLFI